MSGARRPTRPSFRSAKELPPAQQNAEAPVRKSIEVDLSLVEHYDRQLLPLGTEDAYLHWTRRFSYFHGKRHPLAPLDAPTRAGLLALVREANPLALRWGKA